MFAPVRILAADDDVRMREFYEVALRRLGHSVLGIAADGYSLVELGLLVEGPIDLVVTDLRMPRMNGLDAVRTIASFRPVRALFVSAFTDGLPATNLVLPFRYRCLVKPIDLAQLGAEIPISASRE